MVNLYFGKNFKKETLYPITNFTFKEKKSNQSKVFIHLSMWRATVLLISLILLQFMVESSLNTAAIHGRIIFKMFPK